MSRARRAVPAGSIIAPLAALLAVFCLALAAPAAAAPDIVLGAPSSLTTREGADSLLAARLAVEEINRGGGVRLGGERRLLRLAPHDLGDAEPGLAPAQAVERLRGFLEAAKPQALVIGPFRSEVLLESMDLLAEKKIPALVSIAMTPALEAKVLSDPKYRNIFRVGLNTKYLASYLIETMKLLSDDFGFNRVYILNQDVAWARSTASLMIRLYFERHGWQVLGQENQEEGSQDFSRPLTRCRERNAQVLLAIFDSPHSLHLVRQWQEARPPSLLCGFISPASGPQAFGQLGGRLGGLINVIFELGNLPAAKHPPATAFYRAFQERHGQPIQSGHGPAPAYESVHILAQALERAGSLEPERLAAALESTDRQGVMGRVRFHRGRQAVFGQDPREEALACVMQWRDNGQRVIVHPRAIAEGRLRLPSFVPAAD